jgi:molybdenum cofactor guanylyltransferase
MSASTQVTALILAGGRSSRMGTDKALIVWQGKPLLQRVVNAAQQCCATVQVITPWPERYRPLSNSVQWCLESSPAGPLTALAQGLETVYTPWVLLLACDMPQLDPTVLRDWIVQLPDAEAAIAYVPYYESRWEPLCAFYNVSCRSSLDKYIAKGGRSFQEWLGPAGAVPLKVDDVIAPMLQNCNTPKDLVENLEC